MFEFEPGKKIIDSINRREAFLKRSNNYLVSENFQHSLSLIRTHQVNYERVFEPIRRQENILNAISADLNARQDQIYQLIKVSAPVIEIADQYNAMVDSISRLVPNPSKQINQTLSEIKMLTVDSALHNSFPDLLPEQEVIDFIYDNVHDSVSSDTISDIHQNNQNSPDNVLSDNHPAGDTDDVINHNSLLSDMKSKEWHATIWVRGLYTFLINLLLQNTIGNISVEDLQKILTAIKNMFNQ